MTIIIKKQYYFDIYIWNNIIEYLPDYTKQKQILRKNEMLKEFKFIIDHWNEYESNYNIPLLIYSLIAVNISYY